MKASDLLAIIESKMGTEFREFIETTCMEKKKKVVKVKDPNRKKKPLTAYFHFANQRRPLLVAENPDTKMPNISKLLGEEWNKMSDEQKQPYKDMVVKAQEVST
tara:strand:- start:2301 stop:2612 length:312 start_codon:yes stop_codon:yes gene_type:complete